MESVSVGATQSTGTWTSPKFNASKVGGWKYFIADDNGRQTKDYYIKFATSSALLDTASWKSVNSGDLLSGTSTWVQEKVSFATTDGTENPTVRSLTLTWFPDNDLLRPVGRWLNKRYWLAVSTANTYNDLVYVLDKNMAWTKFNGYKINDIVSIGFKGYILDSSTGMICEAETGNVDYTSPTTSTTINAYWQSKDMFLTLDRESELEYLYSSWKRTGGESLLYFAPDFTNNFSSTTIDLSGIGTENDRTPVNFGQISKLWRFKISQNSNENPFEFYGLDIYFKPKALR